MYTHRAAVKISTAFCYFQVSILCINFCILAAWSRMFWCQDSFGSLLCLLSKYHLALLQWTRDESVEISGEQEIGLFYSAERRLSLNAILNFAIFSANTIDFFESFEINWECVEMNDIIGNSESTAWNARSRASGSRTGRVVTVLITNRASFWDSPEADSYPCSSNNPCDIHFHDIILFYLSLVRGCRQSSTVVFGWRDELPTGAMHLISSFFTTDCRNYVRRMIESKTEHLEIV